MKKHPLINEGKQLLLISEVDTIIDKLQQPIIVIKLEQQPRVFTLIHINLYDGMYGIRRARSLCHALGVKFSTISPDLLRSLVGKHVWCNVYHAPYKHDPSIKYAKVEFLSE